MRHVHVPQAVVEHPAPVLVAIETLAVGHPAHIRRQIDQQVVAVRVDVLLHKLVGMPHVKLAEIVCIGGVGVKEADLVGRAERLIVLLVLDMRDAAEIHVGIDGFIVAQKVARIVAPYFLGPGSIVQLGQALGQRGLSAAFRAGDEHLFGKEGTRCTQDIIPVAQDIAADIRCGDGIARAGRVKQHDL